MNKIWDEPMTEIEIELFKSLKDIKVVFDVGVRTSLDYLNIYPDIEYHLFEPNPYFYEWTANECKDKPNVHVNNYGLGDIESESTYYYNTQAFGDGLQIIRGEGPVVLPIKTLDWYIEQNNITRIDFLKIDTEGYDLKVLYGGMKAVEMARYIQYEVWDNQGYFVQLLWDDFEMKDIGFRNFLCTRKNML